MPRADIVNGFLGTFKWNENLLSVVLRRYEAAYVQAMMNQRIGRAEQGPGLFGDDWPTNEYASESTLKLLLEDENTKRKLF